MWKIFKHKNSSQGKRTAMHSQVPIDQMAIIVASGFQPAQLQDALIREGFSYTEMDSSGGLVTEPVVNLLVGLNRDRLSMLLDIVGEHCQPVQQYLPIKIGIPEGTTNIPMVRVEVGGAKVYVLDVERFEQI
jgi:uncharacterized protein YaaQ